MPKELKKRGRRATKRQKLDEDGQNDKDHEMLDQQPQSLGTQAFVSTNNEVTDSSYLPFESSIPAGTTFYGLLDENESEYFRKADEMLEIGGFGSNEERDAFIENVFKEADKKELKLACSQGCSRLLEKLVMLSNREQVKRLWQRFSGHFSNLLTHRFASHCCEALFTRAAPIVTAEMDPLLPQDTAEGEVYVSMENLFLFTIGELESNIDNLLMDRFGSHVLRTLFVVLAGAPLESSTTKNLVKSKKKEKISLPSSVVIEEVDRTAARAVPESFREALSRIINTISDTIDRESVRTLATHELGSPTLQLLIELDLGRPKKFKRKIEESLVGKLLLQLPEEEERDTEATYSFVKSLLQNPIGSHVLETVVRCVPKKTFQQLYGTHFKGKLGSLACDETSMYVVQRILEKMDASDLKLVEEELKPVIPELIEQHRLAIIRIFIETCNKNGVNTERFVDTYVSALESSAGNPSEIVFKMLEISSSDLEDVDESNQKKTGRQNPAQLHASLLAQTLLTISTYSGTIIRNWLVSLPGEKLSQLCQHSTASHVIEKSLTSESSDINYKRRFTSAVLPFVVELAQNNSGSHIVDALWETTKEGMKYQRQRIADSLLASEPILRDSFFGRAVWRNWKMDIYKTRRHDWVNLATQDNTTLQGGVERKGKTAIQLASERHAAERKAKESQTQNDKKQGRATDNAGVGNAKFRGSDKAKPVQSTFAEQQPNGRRNGIPA